MASLHSNIAHILVAFVLIERHKTLRNRPSDRVQEKNIIVRDLGGKLCGENVDCAGNFDRKAQNS